MPAVQARPAIEPLSRSTHCCLPSRESSRSKEQNKTSARASFRGHYALQRRLFDRRSPVSTFCEGVHFVLGAVHTPPYGKRRRRRLWRRRRRRRQRRRGPGMRANDPTCRRRSRAQGLVRREGQGPTKEKDLVTGASREGRNLSRRPFRGRNPGEPREEAHQDAPPKEALFSSRLHSPP